MKKQAGGIEPFRLTQNISRDEITCSICKKIFWEPTACSECLTCFCSLCIEQYVENSINKRCPNFCKFSKRSPPPVIFQILNKLKIKCRNYVNGCKEELYYELLGSHEKNCLFYFEQCCDCKKNFLKRDLNDHQKVCEMQIIFCEKCDLKMTRKTKAMHTVTECLQEQIVKKDYNIIGLQEILKNEKQKRETLEKESLKKIEILLQKINQTEELKEELQINDKHGRISEITCHHFNHISKFGYMFDIEANKNLRITQIGFKSDVARTFKIALYYKMGSHEKNEEFSFSWNLLFENVLTFPKGGILMVPIKFDLELSSSTRAAFYVAYNEGGLVIFLDNFGSYQSFDDIKIYSGTLLGAERFKLSLQENGYKKKVGFVGKIKYITK